MKIAKDTVVSFDYKLTSDDGELLDASEGSGPLSYIHGRAEIVPGLEAALSGKQTGDELEVSLTPEQGYGAYDESLRFDVPRSSLPDGLEPAKGMQLFMSGGGRDIPVTIVDVSKDSVLMDRNHPLAGKGLNFEVRITEVRELRPEDLQDCCSAGTCGS